MRRLERLEPSDHVKGRFLAWFEGESDPLRVTESEILAFSLCVDRTLEETEYAELVSAAGVRSARDRAAQMLSRRAMSRRELERRLREKGESPEDAAAAADRMEELGALDDLEYARNVVRSYSGRGYGLQKLKSELSRRGVPEELWEEVLEEQPDPIGQVVAFLRGRNGVDWNDPRQRQRAVQTLLRRGFSWEEIRTGLLRLGAESEEESV